MISTAIHSNGQLWSCKVEIKYNQGVYKSNQTIFQYILCSGGSVHMPILFTRRTLLGVEEIHSVGIINNIKTSYSTQLKMDKRGTLDQEDTNVHKLGCRILPP